MILLSLFIFFVGAFSFFYKKRHFFIISIILLSSNFFNLSLSYFNIGSFVIQNYDLALLLLIICFPLIKNIKDKELKKIGNSIKFFIVFLIVSVSYDFFFRDNSFFSIFRTTRHILFFLFFFYLESFNKSHYKKVFNFLIIVTFLHSTIYMSQYIFNYSYTTYLDSLKAVTHNEFGYSRYTNGPTFIMPSLILVLFSKYNKILKNLIILVFFTTVILTQGKGLLFLFLTTLLFHQILIKKVKIENLLFSLPFLLLLMPILSSLLLNSFSFQRIFLLVNEYQNIYYLDLDNLVDWQHSGSFIFRLGLIIERYKYIITEIDMILLGVGYLSDAELLRPIFELGTISPNLQSGFEQFNTKDILFPNLLTRYGILGSFIFLKIPYTILRLNVAKIKRIESKFIFLLLVAIFINSFFNYTIYNTFNFISIFIFLGYAKHYNKKINLN